jgi:hypothetical protein
VSAFDAKEKTSACRTSSEEAQVTKKKEENADWRENLVARREVDETVVAHGGRARIRDPIALMRSTRRNKRMEFVNRDVNAAINFSRYAVPQKRPAELTRYKFLLQPLRLDVCKGKLKAYSSHSFIKG